MQHKKQIEELTAAGLYDDYKAYMTENFSRLMDDEQRKIMKEGK